MALSSNSKRAEVWKWEPGYYHPRLTDEQEAMLDATIKEVQQESTLSLDVQGGRSWVWRYMEGAQWRREPVRGKRVSSFFIDTLEWRQRENVDEVLDRAQDFAAEAASGKLFVRGQCLCGRSLIWVHLGRENNAVDPEENVRYLVYTLIDCTRAAEGPLPSLSFARQAVSMLTLHYPSRLGKLLIVNAGTAVYYLWQAISLLLAPVTREKVVIVSGTDEQRREELLQYLSPEALEGGRLGCPGEPAFDAESYLNGNDAAGGAR